MTTVTSDARPPVPALRPPPLRRAVAPTYPRPRGTQAPGGASNSSTAFAAFALVLIVACAALTVVLSTRSAGGSTTKLIYAQQLVANGVAPPGEPAPAPSATAASQRMGGWTPQLGIDIANRALKWLNWPYSFAGGNANGPTYGVAVDADSRNDSHIIGFDCSGLVLYALAPWRKLHHFAADQYLEAGTFHPSLTELQPGDLVFWSTDGTIGGIGHVAVYIGNGNVVQAPRSGELITVTPLGNVERGAIGTTRPLT